MNYQTADAKLGNRESRKLQNNTYLIRRDVGTIAVRLHATDVVTLYSDGTTMLHSGGWRTVTTKDRINTYADGISVFSVKGTWHVCRTGDWDNVVLYDDGMIISETGPIAGRKVSETKASEKRYTKLVREYIKGFMREIEDIESPNHFDPPSNGDCLYCNIALQGSDIGGVDHIVSHLSEPYHVASLLWLAMREQGRDDNNISFLWSTLHANGIGLSIARMALNGYFRRRKHTLLDTMTSESSSV